MLTFDWLRSLRNVFNGRGEARGRVRSTRRPVNRRMANRVETLETRLVLAEDFGDAPDTGAGTGAGNYETLLANNGPRHTIVAGLKLGANVDGEANATANAAANGDGLDEDGVRLPMTDLQFTVGTQPTVTLLATNTTGTAATLYGWIDTNNNGVFDNATERAQIAVPTGTTNGSFTLTFPTILPGFTGTTYARFRLSTDVAAANSTGAASDGEVEDYAVRITRPTTGVVKSGGSTKIDDDTANGPVLADQDQFGNSLTRIGDIDGDGVTDLAVGAHQDDTVANNTGAVYVLRMNADGSVKGTTKIASGTGGGPTLVDGDVFGVSVAGLGDIDGDGIGDIAVGSPGFDLGPVRNGAVYVLRLNSDGTVKSGGITQIANQTNGGPTLPVIAQFGRSIAALGDINGDGVGDLAVGAFGESSYSGAVYVLLMNSDGTVSSSTRIASGVNGGPTLAGGSRFGISLASLGDIDGDETGDLAIGITGAVYLVRLNTDGTAKSHTLLSNPTLGISASVNPTLATAGDLDGNGVTDLLVGSENDNSVYSLFLRADGTLAGSVRIGDGINGGPSVAGTSFGSSVSSLGDFDGDGVVDILVGARNDNTGGQARGAAYILRLDAATFDFGDAPDTGSGTGAGNYATTLVDGGPRHIVTAGLRLGVNVDAEANANANAAASGDGLDEDGVLFPLSDLQFTIGSQPTVTLRATNTTGTAATLYGWVDTNNNGVFDNATERASVTVPDGTTNGSFTLTFPTVPTGFTGKTYARFRLSTDTSASDPTGVAINGEVEDYAATIVTPSNGKPKLNGVTKIGDNLFGGPSLGNQELFGSAVASLGDLDGDGIGDIAVGTRRAGGSDPRGAVFIQFLRADGSVKASTRIGNGTGGGPSLLEGDYFGSALASLGDIDGDGVVDLAVGASGDDGGGISRGAVYILRLNTDGTVKSGGTTKIANGLNGGPTLANFSFFGSSVANLGDLDGDGMIDLAVGAFGESTEGFSRGAVYVLRLNTDGSVKSGGITRIASEVNGGPTLGDRAYFGQSVTSLGDFDGDGIGDLAVGARKDSTAVYRAGAVYILRLNANGTVKSNGITQITSGTNGGPTLASRDYFGNAVSNVGDIDGDGVTDLVVGATGDDTGGTQRGATYVVRLNADGTVKTNGLTKLAHNLNGGPTLADFNSFGSSVAGLGDFDADGVADLIVGAEGDFGGGGPNRGAVFILRLDVAATPTALALTANTIAENQPSGTAVGTFSTTDANPFDTFTYTLIAGMGDADNGSFQIVGNALQSNAVFDFETKPSYAIRVRTTDDNGRSFEQMFTIDVTNVAEYDYGDAPDTGAGTGRGNYKTLAANDGPRHLEGAGLTLGVVVDTEADATANGAANGDDRLVGLAVDDEDGVVSPLTNLQFTIGTQSQVTLRATNTTGAAATLYGWVDYNANGVFDNATERASVVVPDGTSNGLFTLTFPTVPEGFTGTTYARFRLSTDVGAANSTGFASDGEVEDYAVTVVTPSNGKPKLNGVTKIAHGVNGGPSLANQDRFGHAVAKLGDIDGDGVQDLAVGAYLDDTGGDSISNRGAVYVLRMNADGSVKATTKIASGLNGGPSLSDSDFFGSSLAGLGDVDGDGIGDLAVGSTGDDGGGLNRGAVYVLRLNADGTVKASTKLANALNGGPTLSDFDRFGTSVAAVGDLDGDGVGDLAVGSSDFEGNRRGELFLLRLNADGTVKNFTRIAGDENGGPTVGDQHYFGASVAAIGDLDGDGVGDLAVGAPQHDEGGVNRGAVYVLLMNADGSVKAQARIAHQIGGGPTLADRDYFGASVAAVGDVDGDGLPDIAVGARRDDTGGTDRGAVYVLRLNANGTVKTGGITKLGSDLNGGPALADNNRFGSSLVSLGDFDGDGVADLFAGVPLDSTGGAFRGAAYILRLDVPATPTALGLSANTIAENQPIGTAIGTFSSTDANPFDTFTYTLVAGMGDTDNGSFQIVGNALQSNAVFDFETKPSYAIRVRTTDDSGRFFEQMFTIGVTDVNEAPTAIALQNTTTTLAENSTTTPAIKLADILVTDDALGMNTLSLSGTDASFFEIVGTELRLVAGTVLDFETKPSYSVTVNVDDTGVGSTPDATVNFTLNVTNVAEYDYGDAPDTGSGTGPGNYETLLANGGPRHLEGTGLTLGAIVDTEADATANGTANGDDRVVALAVDDEDGVVSPLTDLQFTIGAAPKITLRATNTTGTAATLYGWIDFNNNGVFDNATERASVSVPTGTTNGTFTLTFPVVPTGFTGTTYARFRLSTDVAAANATGTASDGEVEDYAVAIVAASDGKVKPNGVVRIASEAGGGPTLPSINQFGASVASIGDIDGDGIADLAVGDTTDAGGGTQRGAVYILRLNADGTVKTGGITKITHETNGGPTLADMALLGGSLAYLGDIDGDGIGDLAVGSEGDGAGATLRGAIYILRLNADGTVKTGGITKIAHETGGGPTLGNRDFFGTAIVAIGDIDADGIGDLAVSAKGDNTGELDSGAVYILRLNADGTVKSGGITKIASGTNGGPTLAASDFFGTSMTSLGDIDSDGVIDLAVGAAGEDSGLDNLGAVYVLRLNVNGTVKVSTKIASNTNGGPTLANRDVFGRAVASPGDVNGDGIRDLAVGAWADDTGGQNRGAVYILRLNEDGTVRSAETTKIAFGLNGGPTNTTLGAFGGSLAAIGDRDGDGIADLVVGAYGNGSGGIFRGEVYLLQLDGPVSPTALDLSANSIAENQPSGTAIGTFSTTDANVSDTFVYTLVTGMGATDNDSFQIVGNELQSNAAFNFEAKTSYSIRVRTTDDSGRSFERMFTIGITDVNEAPSAVVFQNTTTSLAENTSTASAIKLADIVITDDGLGTNSLSLTGTDAAFFEIVGTALRLKAGTVLNFEAKASYSVTVNVNDAAVGATPDLTRNFTLTVTDVNEAPTTVVFQNTTTSLAENTSTASAIKLADVVITDDVLGTNTLSLTGTDAAFFEIVGTELRLRAGTVLNFEAKSSYSVIVQVDDPTVGATPDATVNYTLTVTNTNDAPVLDTTGSPFVVLGVGARQSLAMQQGVPVSELLSRGAGGDPISDEDSGALTGIALTSIDRAFGTFQYTLVADTPAESDWIDVEAAGAISATNALLLPASARLRFKTALVPHHEAGPQFLALESKLDAGLTFRAWDRTSGSAGGRANTTTNGGSTAFSTETETSRVYFEARLYRHYNRVAGVNVDTLQAEFDEIQRLANINNPDAFEDRANDAFTGFSILMSAVPELSTVPVFRLYFGVQFNEDGTETDMGYRYLTTNRAEAEELELLGPADKRAERAGTYFREIGINGGTGIIGYIYSVQQPGTSLITQIYRTDLVNKPTRVAGTGEGATPSSFRLQESGDHVYTSNIPFESARTGTWRIEAQRGFARELSPNATSMSTTGPSVAGGTRPAGASALAASFDSLVFATPESRSAVVPALVPAWSDQANGFSFVAGGDSLSNPGNGGIDRLVAIPSTGDRNGSMSTSAGGDKPVQPPNETPAYRQPNSKSTDSSPSDTDLAFLDGGFLDEVLMGI